MGKSIEFQRPDGSACRGYLAEAGAGRPGIVVVQEWWGLNDQICGVADRFARAGFNAMAPDLYKGRVAQDADEASHMMNGLDFPGATSEDIRGAVRYLQAIGGNAGGKVGVMGFCMGGALSIAAAVHVPEAAAAVCFYGVPPKDFADPAKIRIPFQGHFANKDTWVTPAVADTIARALADAGNPGEIHHYDADHAFFNERRAEVYDAKCAQLSWDRTVDFLRRKLA